MMEKLTGRKHPFPEVDQRFEQTERKFHFDSKTKHLWYYYQQHRRITGGADPMRHRTPEAKAAANKALPPSVLCWIALCPVDRSSSLKLSRLDLNLDSSSID